MLSTPLLPAEIVDRSDNDLLSALNTWSQQLVALLQSGRFVPTQPPQQHINAGASSNRAVGMVLTISLQPDADHEELRFFERRFDGLYHLILKSCATIAHDRGLPLLTYRIAWWILLGSMTSESLSVSFQLLTIQATLLSPPKRHTSIPPHRQHAGFFEQLYVLPTASEASKASMLSVGTRWPPRLTVATQILLTT